MHPVPRWPVWAVIGAAITGLQRRMHARKLVSCQRHPNGVCLLCGSVVLLALVAMQCVCIGTVTSYLCTMLTVAVTLLRCEGCVCRSRAKRASGQRLQRWARRAHWTVLRATCVLRALNPPRRKSAVVPSTTVRRALAHL